MGALRIAWYGVIVFVLVGVKHAFEDKAREVGSVASGESRFEQAWLAPTAPHLDALSRMLDRAFDDALTWAELYRAWLLYYSIFLATLMAFAVYRLLLPRAAT
jgi:hypothetical protein